MGWNDLSLLEWIRWRRTVKKTPAGNPQTSAPKKSAEEMWYAYRRFCLDMINQFREKGLLTDEHLRRFPILREAIAERRAFASSSKSEGL